MKRSRRGPALVLASLLSVAAAVSCGILDPEDPDRDALESARDRWEDQGPDSYRMNVTRICFCAVEWIGPVLVRVTPTGVTRTYVSDGRAVLVDAERFFPTVEGLFDEIEEALEEGAHRVQATYDPRSGAPLEVFIDYDERVADEEQGWTLTAPEPL
jgi:hypothetical protein